MNVAVEAGVTNDKTLPIFIGRANASMLGLASQLDSSALDDELASILGAAATAAAAESTSVVEETELLPLRQKKKRKMNPKNWGTWLDLFG